MADSRYILAKKIARGGMAEIFLGKQVGEDGFARLCAIKRILPHYAQDQEFIQMFRDEAHICKRLQHANIVRVEGFEEVDGSYAMIMEYVDGPDLRSLLHACEQAKRRIDVPMACYIIAEASRGLHYAHTKVDEITQQPIGIVHRDISPQNLLISYEGEIKVTDFGIADASGKITETRPGIVKGKYSYMSPEQISAKDVDARTDVFALAIVLWEMLAMRRLFQGENEVDTIQRVKACKIDYELRKLNAKVDEELDAIIKQGLAKDPKRRYQTAVEFEKALRRYLSRHHPDFTPQDLGNFIKKVMDKKRQETAAEIKKALTETNQKPSTRAKKPAQIDLSLGSPKGDSKDAPSLKLAGPGGGQQRKAPRPTASSPRQLPGANANKKPAQRANMTRNNTYVDLPYNPRHQEKGSVFKAMAGFGMIAAAIALVIWYLNQDPNQTQNAKLLIESDPPRVRVFVNNQDYNNGEWVNATPDNPIKLNLKPGKHRIRISRPDYQDKIVEYIARAGRQDTLDSIVLKPKPNRKKAAVKIQLTSYQQSALVSINRGYFRGTLSTQNKVLTPADLMYGRRYVVQVRTAAGKTFSCRFSPKSINWTRPTTLIIDPTRGRCGTKGP